MTIKRWNHDSEASVTLEEGQRVCWGMTPNANGEFVKLSSLRELLKKEREVYTKNTWEGNIGHYRKGKVELIDWLLAELSSVDASSTARNMKKGLEKVTK